MEKDASVATADYTITYMYGSETVKTSTGNAVVGSGVVTEASFFVDGVKYFRADGQSESFEIGESGNDFSVSVRLAETYSYTLSSSLGTTISTGSGLEGETVNVGYSRYQLQETKFYEAAVTNKEYRKSLALTSDNVSQTVDYSEKTETGEVVFCQEAEALDGFTTVTSGNIPARASNALAAVSSEDVVITSLPAGKYIIHAGAFTSKSTSQTIYIGYGEIQIGFSSSSNLNETASDEIVLTESTDIKYFGTTSSGDAQFDYIWIEKTGNITIPVTFKYVDENRTDLSEYHPDVVVYGEPGTYIPNLITEDMKADFYVDEEQTIKYAMNRSKYLVMEGDDNRNVPTSGAVTVELEFIQHIKSDYKIMAQVDGEDLTVLASGKSFLNDDVRATWSKFIQVDNQWYVADGETFKLYINSSTKNNVYPYSPTNHVDYFFEAEDLECSGEGGVRTDYDYESSTGSIGLRAGAAFTTPSKVAAGTYTLTVRSIKKSAGEQTYLIGYSADGETWTDTGKSLSYTTDQNKDVSVSDVEIPEDAYIRLTEYNETDTYGAHDYLDYIVLVDEALATAKDQLLTVITYAKSIEADELADAIGTAQAAYEDTDATAESVNQATAALVLAVKQYAKGALQTVLELAEEMSDNSGELDEEIETFKAGLDEAINAANAALDDDEKTPEDIMSALNELSNAALVFASVTLDAAIEAAKAIDTEGKNGADELAAAIAAAEAAFRVEDIQGFYQAGLDLKQAIDDFNAANEPVFDPSTVLKNPSFEYSAEGTASTAQALTNGGSYYGWTLPALGTSFVNISIGDASNCNGQAFGIPAAKDGNFYYFARRGWNGSSSADASLSTTMTALPVGHYTLTMAYKGLDSWDDSHSSKGSYLKLNAVVGETELGAAQTEAFEAVKGNSAGDGKFAGDANWKEASLEFDVETEGDVTLDIVHHLVGGVRTDVVIDNLTLAYKSPEEVAAEELAAAKEVLEAEIAKAKLCAEKENLSDAIAAAEDALTTAATVEAIEEALATLQAADKDAVLRYENGLADATATEPVVTSFVVNGTFDSGISGWSCTGGFQNNQTANNQQGDFTGNFYENWNGSGKANKMYQIIEDIPNGTYKLKIAAFVNTLADPNESQYVFANEDKAFLTTTAPKFYEVYTFVENNKVEIGLEQTDVIANWMGIDNVSLTYYGAVNSVSDLRLAALQGDYADAKEAAEAALANEEYANVTGEEKTALSAEIGKDEPTNLEDYEEAVNGLRNATNTFIAAKESYDNLIAAQRSTTVPELTYAAEVKKEALQTTLTATATSAADAVEKTAAITTALRAYYESNALAEGIEGAVNVTSDYLSNYVNPTNVDGWTITNTVGDSKMRIMSDEPYINADGSVATGYFDSNSWGTAFTTKFTQSVKLPAGRYILSAKARGNGTTEYKVIAGENGADVNAIGNQGGVFGRGWNDYTVEFELTEEQEVALGMQMATGNDGNWLSFGDFRLVRIATAAPTAPDLAITNVEISGGNPYEMGSEGSCYFDYYFENRGNAAVNGYTVELYDGEEKIWSVDWDNKVVEASGTGEGRFTLSTVFLTEDGAYMPGVYNLSVKIVCADDADETNNASEALAATLYVVGDANIDGEVSTGDAVATVSYALEKLVPSEIQQLSADINKSNTITVADAVGIVNLALNAGEPELLSDGARSTEPQVDYLTMNGTEMGLVNTTAFSGFQMDVTLSDGAVLGGVQLTERANGLTLTVSQLSADTWRIIALSLDGSVISGSNGSLLSLDVMGQGSASVSHVEFADRAANAYELGFITPTGISTLYNNKVEGEVYTVSGTRTGSMKRGVNVVRQADGKVSKVLVK